jgi:hypothetical protein
MRIWYDPIDNSFVEVEWTTEFNDAMDSLCEAYGQPAAVSSARAVLYDLRYRERNADLPLEYAI